MMSDKGSDMDSSAVENVGAVAGNVPLILSDMSRTQSVNQSLSLDEHGNEKDRRIAELEQIAKDRLAYIDKLEKEISDKDILIAKLNVDNDIHQAVETEKVKEKAESDRVRGRIGTENEKLKENNGRLKGEIGVLEAALDKEKKSSRSRSKALVRWRITSLCVVILTVILCGIVFTKLNCEKVPVCPEVCPSSCTEHLIKKIALLEEKIEQLNKDKVEITVKINDYKVEVSRMKGRNTDLELEKKEMVSKLEGLEESKSNLEKDFGVLKAKHSSLETTRDEFAKKIWDLERDVKEKDHIKEKLESDIDGLQTRLSKCQSVNEIESVSESDLSPIKLGQQHRLIYDQDYTMAVDELEDRRGSLDTKETVVMFLDILKTAYKYTEEITKNHTESMKQTVLSVHVDLPAQSQDGQKSVSVYGSLSKMDWKDFYSIRQKCAWRMRDSLVQELGKMIAKQFNFDPSSQPKMMTYINSCIDLCWKAHMHREPIYLDFYEPDTSTVFDSAVYKPFMYPRGEIFDYLVWPPVYERRGGAMIAKGVAERKD